MLSRFVVRRTGLDRAFQCITFRGRASSAQSEVHFKNLVVGAGPAGLAVVATLLDGNGGSVLWIDPQFQAGRLALYSEVPSNTKTKLFAKFATTSPSLAAISEPALQPFQGLDPERGCPLGCAQQMVQRLTEGVRSRYSDQVKTQVGKVETLDHSGGRWQIDGGELTAERVFLATGAHPKQSVSHKADRPLTLDDALVPSRLQGRDFSNEFVGVIGSSHSAILAMRNLLHLDNGPRVINFFRSPLRYASFLEDGRIANDNTGLKGVAAEWAEEELETRVHERSARLVRINTSSGPLMDIDISSADLTVTMNIPSGERIKMSCNHIINATGFERNQPPRMTWNGNLIRKFQHDKHSGCIVPNKLFGYGIAWPEEVTDPIRKHKEDNVGLWKFMRYVREALPAQQLCREM